MNNREVKKTGKYKCPLCHAHHKSTTACVKQIIIITMIFQWGCEDGSSEQTNYKQIFDEN